MALNKANEEDPGPKETTNIRITGGGSHQVAGRDLHISVDKLSPPKVIVKTGDGVLNAAEKATLRQLVAEVVEASLVKQRPRTHASVWNALNRRMHVNSYSEIKSTEFATAVSLLRRDLAVYMARASAKKKVPGWRVKRIRAIQSRCRERQWEDWRRRYMREKFGRESLVELSDDEVETLYRATRGKR